MITFNHIPFMLWPLVLIVSVMDIYLFLTASRILLGFVKNAQAQKLCGMLRPLTDSIPDGINTWMIRRMAKYTTVKTCWIITLGGIMLLRYIILFVLVWSSH